MSVMNICIVLTVYDIKVSEHHFNMIPFQEAALSSKRLSKNHILVIAKCECLH